MRSWGTVRISTSAAGGGAPSDTEARFRPDIEGLRAVAVLFVLVHHAGEPLLPGGFAGVDMFFVVSGFVITTQLVREVQRTGSVDLLGFYSRRAKRLLPAATLVLVTTTLAAWLMASRVEWRTISGDVIGSALYVVNWLFAARSVDYLAEDVDPSPVQHYWSLAVEEQFYLIWPVLILGLSAFGLYLRRRAGTRADPVTTARLTRTVLALGLTVLVVLPSLAWSIWYTAADPQQAYFVTTTRLWELGLGALVAVLAPVWSVLRPAAAAALGWVGLVVLLVSSVVLDTSVAWPGSAALVPTVATASIIVAGFRAGRLGPVQLLGRAPVVWVGGLSYSLYLWHWPLLVMAGWQFGPLAIWAGVLVVIASVIPAWLGYRWVEHPLRHSSSLRSSPRFALSVGANLSLVSVVAALMLWASVNVPAPPPAAADGGREAPQPQALGEGPADGPLFEQITPDPTQATVDLPALYAQSCDNAVDDATVNQCVAGDEQGDVVVAMVGDSKIAQWGPALDAIAKEQGWRLEIYIKSACPLTTALTILTTGPYENCQVWGADVLDQLTGPQRPDVVVTSAVRDKAVDEEGANTLQGAVDGYQEAWQQLADAGVDVVALSDTPGSPAGPVYECVADNPEDPDAACSWPFEDGPGSAALRGAAERMQGVEYIDMNRWVCPDGTCHAIYRNVLTYRQGSHLTATYAGVLAPPLREELVPMVEAAVKG